ncbi:MAG: glycoside hydrolase family 15 protein [Flavobacteriaceae bacterium]|nr:glycoside hydrolase family 15 protein [Flavobacteriaceae bacterium]
MSDNLNYGIIGNCKSAALINEDTSIDWLCLPQFDSPSVFAKILDDQKGGHFLIKNLANYTIKQAYLENSNILRTEFRNEKAGFEVIDFMPRYKNEINLYYTPPEVIRIIRPLYGTPSLSIDYFPALEYAAAKTDSYAKKEFIVSVYNHDNYDTLYLYSNLSKEDILEGNTIELTQDVFFTISYNEKLQTPSLESCLLELERTKLYWLNWCDKTPTYQYYNEVILRSAMTLKLLTYDKTGAILAAATTSLPESIGEVRNWDYRFCWIRDSSMVIRVISKLGHKKIVKDFIDFIIDLIPEKDEKIQIMYGINKEKKLTETLLDHLSGYENSNPVRIGNAAYKQKQNDIYGILMDAIHVELVEFPLLFEKKEELWSIVKNIVWIVDNNWFLPDKGIWEIREEDKHFTFSKVLCWVAIDRAIKIADFLGKDKDKWINLREEIKKDILEKAWNPSVEAYTQFYGSDALDASVLLMEQYGFIDALDERYIKTVKATEKELSYEGLLFRYKNEDDFGTPTSSFTVCTFWFINSLYKIGEVDKAKAMFDQLLSYSNHLGLFSEDLDFKTKRLLGNFPQAYSHLALIDVALTFNKIKH